MSGKLVIGRSWLGLNSTMRGLVLASVPAILPARRTAAQAGPLEKDQLKLGFIQAHRHGATRDRHGEALLRG
jgi:hypothetical protein